MRTVVTTLIDHLDVKLITDAAGKPRPDVSIEFAFEQTSRLLDDQPSARINSLPHSNMSK
jgi:hypothetical protein